MFKPAKMGTAFFKFGVYGDAGSGKTFTAARVAIGLHGHIKAKKPVGFIDSEGGSDFIIGQFERAKVPLITNKTKIFEEMAGDFKVAQKECSILIIDSISHYWDELQDAYRKKKKIAVIRKPNHWMEVKAIWREEFSYLYVDALIHILVCGRSGQIWDDVIDDEGVKETKPVGTKMRTEKELAYEPNLLIEMEKVPRAYKVGASWIHRAWVVKDRFDESGLNGNCFDDPTFETFLPHIELLNIGGKHIPISSGGDSSELFNNPNIGMKKYIKREQLLEGIQTETWLLHPGQDKESKKSRLSLTEKVFGTNVWGDVKEMDNVKLDKGYKFIKQMRIESKEE